MTLTVATKLHALVGSFWFINFRFSFFQKQNQELYFRCQTKTLLQLNTGLCSSCVLAIFGSILAKKSNAKWCNLSLHCLISCKIMSNHLTFFMLHQQPDPYFTGTLRPLYWSVHYPCLLTPTFSVKIHLDFSSFTQLLYLLYSLNKGVLWFYKQWYTCLALGLQLGHGSQSCFSLRTHTTI